MMEATPPQPTIIIVEQANTQAPTIFFGFMAVGDEPAMKALETAATAVALPAGRTKNDKDQVEVMVVFPVGTDRNRAMQLYHDARVGRFGPLRLEVTVAPQSALADGKIEMDTEVSVEPVSTIIDPIR